MWDKIKHLSIAVRSVTENDSIITANGTSSRIEGIASIPYEVNGKIHIIDTLLVSSLISDLLLGVDFLSKFHIVPDIANKSFTCNALLNQCAIVDKAQLSVTERSNLNKITDEYFNSSPMKLGRTSVTEHIIDTGDAPAIKQRYYPVSPHISKFINSELDEMLKLGVVEPSRSAWSSPVVVVKKASGDYRFCIDFRKVNSVTKKDAYPLPYVSAILDRLGGAKYLSSLDLNSAFWQIPLEASSRERTAFTVPGRGLFQFVTMPFGLCGAPATMQRLVDTVFGPELEPFVFVYLDDIIIATPDYATHLKVLEQVFRRLRAANLTLNREKCHFARRELRYLGYIIDSQGLRVDPEKISAIQAFPVPKCPKDVRRFIGLASWYRRFIHDFSKKIVPLTRLTRKNAKFTWSAETEKAFTTLKECLVSAPIMACPDFSRSFSVQTDASSVAIGAVLTQDAEDGERVIAYASRTLNKHEQNYSACELEILAVLWAVEKFRCYIEASHFKIITDHQALLWLNKLQEPKGKLARWALRLQQYDYEVIHRKGTLHTVPDALSRAVSCLEIKTEDQDNWYRNMLIKIENQPEAYASWKIQDGKIFKLCNLVNPASPDEDPWKLVLPKALRTTVLTKYHDEPTAGHLGIFKTKCRIAASYYWPRMSEDIIQYVRSCEVCQAHKVEQRPPAGLLGKRSVCRPWQYVCTDLIGPLPMSKDRNRYILVFCDMFTKYSLFFPIRTANSKTLCSITENKVFLVYGTPDYMICDNGRQYVSNEFRDLLTTYSVKLQLTANFHPSANPTERTNRTIKTMIVSYIKQDQREWDINLPKLQYALCTATHEVTGFTPAFLNFGRELRINGAADSFDTESPLSVDKRVDYAERFKKLHGLQRFVRQRLDSAFLKNSTIYDRQRRNVNYVAGEMVWKRNPVLSDGGKYFAAKLAPKYIKCRITRRLSDSRYQLENMHHRNVGVWHVSMLKPFISR